MVDRQIGSLREKDKAARGAGGGGGVVLQVLQDTLLSTASSTSTTYGDTGLSVAITPSSTGSKVLVIANISGSCVDTGMALILLRDSTSVLLGAAAGSRLRAATGMTDLNQLDGVRTVNSTNITFLDTPATTSEVTYKIQYASHDSGNGVHLNRSGDDADDATHIRAASTLVVMEISG